MNQLRAHPLLLLPLLIAWWQGCGTSQWERGGLTELPAQEEVAVVRPVGPRSSPEKMTLRPGPLETVQVPSVSPGQASEPVIPAASAWQPLDYWAGSQGLGSVTAVSTNQFHLSTHWGVFGFAERALYAIFNGWRFHLGYPIRITNGIPYLHQLDAEKNLRPLITSYERVPRGNGVICIDAGHGGKHTGTKSTLGEFFEKTYSLDWALRLKPLLEQRGWRVVLTRDRDVTMSLPDRIQVADQADAALFVSLHFNAAGPGAAGLETYCTTPRGMPSTLTRGYSDPMRASMPNNPHDRANLHLAARVHSTLLRHVGMGDRGIRRARFMTVIAQQKRPAVLIEGGYLSDPEEARKIATGAYRQKLAEAVAMALH
jgi:N-acetylmuramoyl-L-alanine amidase